MLVTASSLDDRAARRLIAGHLGVSEALVLDIVRLDDLGADRLDIVAVGTHLERAAGLPRGAIDFEGCNTVGDMLALIPLNVVPLTIGSRGVGAPPVSEASF